MGEAKLRGGLSSRRSWLATCVLLICLCSSHDARGWDWDHPRSLLNRGDEAVLVAPEACFAAEIARMDVGRARWRAVARFGVDPVAESLEAELSDLRKALKQAGTPPTESEVICNEHQHQRQILAQAIEAYQRWQWSYSNTLNNPAIGDGSANPTRPAFPELRVVQGLPMEFANYFQGFIAWQNPGVTDKQAARSAWERLLALPEGERRYKSTWAAFMLGKSWEEQNPEKALACFKQVRDLAAGGCRDSLGLAAASLGLEARVYLKQKNYEAAIETYLEQLASGDPSATNSLATTAAEALTSGPESLRLLARNDRTEKVITAYIISRPLNSFIYDLTSSEHPGEMRTPASLWLDAAEAANLKDADSTEALALAAYRAKEIAKANRWIQRAPGSALGQWLKAKLLLRAGKLQAAAAWLARLSPQFPIVHEGTNPPPVVDRKDTLRKGDDYWRVSAERQLQGELGVLQLSRGEYTQALHSLLNAGFWMDAAYVAERVLTLDELKNYVDRFWPPASSDQIAQEKELLGESEVCPAALREEIRYLLARRLTREWRRDQAREYYPDECLAAFDQLKAACHSGWDETLSSSERATALLQAAWITRQSGMELMGTEVAPDWHYHLGQSEWGVTGEFRATNALAVVVRPSQDELRRNAEHRPDPDTRFHYRYQAASLAWEAAKLLPDNNDQTAYALWAGGCFLKHWDPQTADFFYKALVRRNRNTVLGVEAERQRWFPSLDANGSVIPKIEKVKNTSESSEPNESPQTEFNPVTGTEPPELNAPGPAQPEETQGYVYVVHSGDSLASIAQKSTEAGSPVSPLDILGANPGLNPRELKVGQKLFVPANKQ